MELRPLPLRSNLEEYEEFGQEMVSKWESGQPEVIEAIKKHWDQFIEYLDALKRENSPIAKFEAAVEAIITGDVATFPVNNQPS